MTWTKVGNWLDAMAALTMLVFVGSLFVFLWALIARAAWWAWFDVPWCRP